MNAPDNLSYEFGPFLLEPHARRLSRDGESVPLAAPEFELLLLLVRNRGRVVEKREIMDTVWPDAEVEENNLTVRMSALRRALGETKGHHPYIQTVTGRGYCMIVQVKELPRGATQHTNAAPDALKDQSPATLDQENTDHAATSQPSVDQPLEGATPPAAARRTWTVNGIRLFALLVVALLASASVLYAVLRWKKSPAAVQTMKMNRVTHTGRVRWAAISPDGQNIVYVQRDDEMSSLWLQRAGSNHPLQLLPPAKLIYKEPAFSRDGNTIYYSKCQPSCQLYRIPVLGGVETALGFRADSSVTFSPDGKRMAYVRSAVEAGSGVVRIFVANADGTGEQALNWSAEANAYQGGAPAWSPDGKMVAVPIMMSHGGQAYMKVIGVGVADRAQPTLTTQRWRYIGDVAWLPTGDGFIISARDEASAPELALQIWRISYPGGQARRITNDLNNYMRVTVSTDGSTLMALEMHWTYSLWITPAENPSAAQQLTHGTIDRRDGYLGVSMTPDDELVYVSDVNGKRDLWKVNSDGSGQVQLTDGPHRDFYPNVTTDGRYVVFESTREGAHSIWRVDADGRNPKRLTRGMYDAEPVCSPDGKWVVYVAHEERRPPKLRKVSIDGGDSVSLTEEFAMHPAFSPDGKVIAYYRMDTQKRERRDIVIIPAGGGAPVKTLPAPNNFGSVLRWAPASNALTYRDNSLTSLWRLPLDGSEPSRITTLRGENLYTFCYSRDGRRLAYASGPNVSDVILMTGFN